MNIKLHLDGEETKQLLQITEELLVSPEDVIHTALKRLLPQVHSLQVQEEILQTRRDNNQGHATLIKDVTPLENKRFLN